MPSNVPRTFVNHDTCFLSFDPAACHVETQRFGWEGYSANGDEDLPHFYLHLTPQLLRGIYTVTSSFKTTNDSGTAAATRYLYAVDGLQSEDDLSIARSCQQNAQSRWVKIEGTELRLIPKMPLKSLKS